MEINYTTQKNILILISLLKEHGIKKIVASPGTNNMPFVASIQNDCYFEIYSSVDERSAAYIACGLAAESGEAVVITCTGATASRNYMSGLTEAFYRKLPILAVTATRDIALVGQNMPQSIDRRVIPNDIAKKSVHVPELHTEQEERNYTVLINDALLELKRHGGGPVHINLTVSYGRDFSIKTLPKVSVIKRIYSEDVFPTIPQGNVAIYVGAHKKWNEKLIKYIDEFCEKYNAVVFADHIANYNGKYKIMPNIVIYQKSYHPDICNVDLMIYIGDIIGTDFQNIVSKQVWRVNPDGEVRNTFGKLSYVFEMNEDTFFEKYCERTSTVLETSYYKMWKSQCAFLRERVPELPFSNIWVAQQTLPCLPKHVVIHFGIQNSLRCWNFFESNNELFGYCNTGGFGIDGCVSTLIGASLSNPEKVYYGVVGDLAFFYDMNVLGNRHVGNNVRLIVINNGRGQQFRNPGSAGEQFGDDADKFIAAAGHYGNQSKELLKHLAVDLGFEYIVATDKESYLQNQKRFLSEDKKSIIFEVFTKTSDESEAMRIMKSLHEEVSFKESAKQVINKVAGEQGVELVRKFLKKM